MDRDADDRSITGLEIARFVVGVLALGAVTTVVVAFLITIGLPLVSDRFSVVVVSDSMAPTIKKGDVVVLAPPPDEPLDRPSVILFPTPQGDTLHRIHDVKPDGSIETKGDANLAPDTTLVNPADVKGLGTLLVPRLAIALVWMREGRWLLAAAFVLVSACVLYASRWGLSDVYDPWLIADARRRARQRDGIVDIEVVPLSALFEEPRT
jgi:signal peptidase I